MQNPQLGTTEALANTDSSVGIISCALQTALIPNPLRLSLAHWDSCVRFVIQHYGFDVGQGFLPTGTAAFLYTLLSRLSTQQFLLLVSFEGEGTTRTFQMQGCRVFTYFIKISKEQTPSRQKM